MADPVQAGRPRVALIFGDAAAVKHLRDAVAEQVDVVYDVQAADFDVARLAELHVAAALVNLDSFEWLDAIGAQLSKAGVVVVFNDPEISSQLDGWERARWLRHLVAKLRHSDDYDPPRPTVGIVAPAAAVEAAEVVAAAPEPVTAPVLAQLEVAATSEPMTAPMLAQAPQAEPTVTARPLSAQEIESMVVDFSAEREPSAVVAPAAEQNEVDANALDVDTEALSAMIDARLAESEPHMPEPPGVWRVDEGDKVAPVDLTDPVVMPDVAADAVATTETTPTTPVVAPPDDSDVLADLPALDDWQLLDPDLPVAAVAATQHAEPAAAAVTDALSGLELVPMETVTPIELHSEPVEHRLYVERRKQAASDNQPATDTNGEHA